MKIHIKDNRPCILEHETLVAQAVKVYSVQFEFGNEWTNFVKTAVFRVGDQSWEQMLVDDACIIPWEALEKVGRLYISVYGINGDIRRPTTETEGVPIRTGAEPGDEAKEPTPDKYSQLLSALSNKQDKLTGLPGQVVGFDKDGNAVAQEPTGGGGGGVTSFNGRNGAVRPAAGDYTAEMVGTYDKATIDQKLEEATPEGYATEQYVDNALLGKQDKLVGEQTQLVGFNADGEAVAVSKDDAVPQIGIGTVTTLAPESSATATITGDATAPKINLGIPRGADGAAGAPGADGAPGKDGVTPVFSIGTVETLPAGSEATASIGGTAEAPTLNLGIPKGDQGDGADIVVDTEVTADSGNPVSGGAVKSYVDSVLGMVLSEMDAMTFGEAE